MLLLSFFPKVNIHFISLCFVILELLLLGFQIFCLCCRTMIRGCWLSRCVLILLLLWNFTLGYEAELDLLVTVNVLSLLIVIVLMMISFLRGYRLDGRLKRSEAEQSALDAEERFALVCKNYQLSVREIEIVVLIKQGLTYKLVAENLHISESTVDTHMQNIYTKVGVRGKIALLNALEG